MTTRKIETGLVTFWGLSEFSNRERLRAGLELAGWGKETPSPMENVTALKHALSEVYTGSRYLIRPLSNRNGFAVMHEERGDEENQVKQVVSAKIGENGLVLFGDQTAVHMVEAAYARYLGRVIATQVSSALVRILHGMGGIRLRPSGSIYWLHGSKAEEWQAVCQAIEGAAEGGHSTGYTIAHNLDANAITAVQDAIIHEVNTEAKRLSDIILSGEVGERAIKARKAEAAELQKKVEQYENILGVGLQHLKKTLDDVSQTNAVAALLAAAMPSTESQPETSHATCV